IDLCVRSVAPQSLEDKRGRDPSKCTQEAADRQTQEALVREVRRAGIGRLIIDYLRSKNVVAAVFVSNAAFTLVTQHALNRRTGYERQVRCPLACDRQVNDTNALPGASVQRR